MNVACSKGSQRDRPLRKVGGKTIDDRELPRTMPETKTNHEPEFPTDKKVSKAFSFRAGAERTGRSNPNAIL